MSDEMPEWVKEIEEMTQDAFNKPQHYSEDELELMPDFRKLLSALRCAIKALEYFKDAMHNEGEELKEGYAREALEKIKEGKFDE